MSPGAGRALELIGAILAVIAGVYLLVRHGSPVAGGQSWFEALAHGIGLYFLGRGAWMLGNLGMQRSTVEALDRLVDELAGGWPEKDQEP